MALIKCPQCGRQISDKSKQCIGCGWVLNTLPKNEQKVQEQEIVQTPIIEEHDLKNDAQENMTDENKLEKSNINENTEDLVKGSSKKTNNGISSFTKKVLIVGTTAFFIAAGVFFYKANYVKNEYYNSDSFYSLNKNAYVGGDAYNYIINGTYFTGYSVIGVGCMICAVIMGTSVISLSLKENEE